MPPRTAPRGTEASVVTVYLRRSVAPAARLLDEHRLGAGEAIGATFESDHRQHRCEMWR